MAKVGDVIQRHTYNYALIAREIVLITPLPKVKCNI
jgi:hypothetical protein